MKQGTIVFFRAEDSVLPALVVAARKGGPAPKGSDEPDPAWFADLCVFTPTGPQMQLATREGDQVGQFAAAAEAPAAAKKRK